MAEEETQPKKSSKRLPVIAIVGIGCLGLLVLGAIIMTVAGKVLVSKFGTGLVKKGIESQTGVKIDTNKGEMSFTDKQTGQTVNIGEQKIPENFPKDFPLYPKAKAKGSLSGGQEGLWLVLATDDAVSKVTTYYESNLPATGWTISNTLNVNDTTTWSIEKGSLSGTLVVMWNKNDSETSINISLGTKEKTDN